MTEDEMASPTRWTWVWVNSGRWWWTGRPGVLWFMGLQRVGDDWATELNWTELKEENLSFSPTLKKLKYILHTVKFTLNFNAYVQFSGFSIFVMLYNYHHWFQNVFITQKETWVYHFSFPLVSKPWHPLIYWYFLSLLICPFWTFYMNC